MIELFHGDFGRGFYLTSIEEHAKDRADHKARIYGTPPVFVQRNL